MEQQRDEPTRDMHASVHQDHAHLNNKPTKQKKAAADLTLQVRCANGSVHASMPALTNFESGIAGVGRMAEKQGVGYNYDNKEKGILQGCCGDPFLHSI